MNRFREHFEGILHFWERARDRERGGFHHLIDASGTVIPGNNKVILIQARLLYNYAEGLLAGLDFCQEPAGALYDFISGSMRTPGGWYTSITEGRLFSPAGLDTYMNLFVVLAMARYAQATGRADVREEAWRLLEVVEGKTVIGQDPRNGLLGCWGEGERGFAPIGRFAGNNVLHYLEALICLREAGLESRLGARVGAVRDFFLARILSRTELVTYDAFLEGFDNPDRRPGAYVSQAHGLEWFGFFRAWPGAELPREVERGLLDTALHNALQPDGNFTDAFFLTEQQCAGTASFWTQSEAVKAFCLAQRLYGAPYDDAFQRTADYYFTRFLDRDGGVFSSVDRNGVATSRMKGHAWKADYHSLRMCVEAMKDAPAAP